MNHRGLKAVVSELSGVIREFVTRETTAFAARLDAMDARFAALPVPRDGKDADPELIKAMVAEAVAKAFEGHQNAAKAIVLSDVAAEIEKATEKWRKEFAERMDAVVEEADLEALHSDVESLRKAIADIPAPSPAPELPDIPAMVADAVAALPAPEPGKSVTLDDVRPVVDEAVQKAVAAIPAAKDGLGLASMLIDREGCLVATMTDGSTKSLGPVVGKDGAPGLDGKDGSPGEAGKDGRDGFGFDDLALDVREDGAFLRFMRGEEAKEFRLPVPIYRGLYADGKSYLPGDVVSWGGSMWISETPTEGKPDTGNGWRLSVKKGRDGREIVRSDPPKAPKVKI